MRILLFANTDWYLFNFRLPLARALQDAGHEVLLLSPDGEIAARYRKIHLFGYQSQEKQILSAGGWTALTGGIVAVHTGHKAP